MSAARVFFTALNPLFTGRTWCFFIVCSALVMLPEEKKTAQRCCLNYFDTKTSIQCYLKRFAYVFVYAMYLHCAGKESGRQDFEARAK